ncbi:MAG: lamin tail domain-containing protein, partial [Verrucomicrobiota bacterium]
AAATDDFPGMIQHVKNYVINKTNTYLTGGDFEPRVASDRGQQPDTPVLTYTGDPAYPVNELSFEHSAFSSPLGRSFVAREWRIAEVTDLSATNFNPLVPRNYEITATWESAELTNGVRTITVPVDDLRVGRNYRVRVRVKDDLGRWSHWSKPHGFISGEPLNALALVSQIRVTEVMFNPRNGDGLEFVELQNIGGLPLDLGGSKFTSGIDYVIPTNTVLNSGEYLLVVRADPAGDFAGFRAAYGLGSEVKIVGPYDGQLADGGEDVTLKTASAGSVIAQFDYNDGRGWPLAADGPGHSMIPLLIVGTNQASGALDYPGNWRASTFMFGSPGMTDSNPPLGVVINEMVAHSDFSNTNFPGYDSNDKVELYNRSTLPVNMEHWYLSDDRDNLVKWAFPALVIPGSTHAVFDEVSAFHSPLTNGFGLNKDGEELLLSYLPGNANDRVVDAFTFKGQENNIARGRVGDGGAFHDHELNSISNANLPPL